jgi:uncharacterized protein YigE (DUF2233 family)
METLGWTICSIRLYDWTKRLPRARVRTAHRLELGTCDISETSTLPGCNARTRLLRRQAVKFFWKKSDGQPYGYLSSLPQSLGDRSELLLFAINAGMYHPDYRPVGLYVENGRELVRANTKAGPGNFHMKPNGVLYIAGDAAGVEETGSFLRKKPPMDFASQSGPMLVINGRLHPGFARNGGSRKYRSGVGDRDGNSLVFAISETEVSF